MQISRRALLGKAAVGAAGVLFLPPALRSVFAGDCSPTPRQDLGPFHPTRRMGPGLDGMVHGIPGRDMRRLLHEDNDNVLTEVRGRAGSADLGRVGYVLYVFGSVTDEDCDPIAGAEVEIWQACVTGRYNHQQQVSRDRFDPDFQYTGRAVTNAQGAFLFKTVQPGAYRNDPSWVRPPHIHAIIGAPGYHDLTTQLYLSGTDLQFGERLYGPEAFDILNGRDNVIRNWLRTSDDRRRATSAVTALADEPNLPADVRFEDGARQARYDIVLRRNPLEPLPPPPEPAPEPVVEGADEAPDAGAPGDDEPRDDRGITDALEDRRGD